MPCRTAMIITEFFVGTAYEALATFETQALYIDVDHIRINIP